MSREQWGHGYWSGVSDQKYGKVKKEYDFEHFVKFEIYHMSLSNKNKMFDRSLYPVSELICQFRFAGYPGDKCMECAKQVYDYVMKYEPLGCYISGYHNDPWHNDYFVLGHTLCLSEEELLNLINDEINEMEETA